MGGFTDHQQQEARQSDQMGPAQSELLLSLPGALLHQVMEESMFPLAEGTFNVVSVVMPDVGNKIGLVAKVGNFEYPLAKDTACLRSAPYQYVFVLTDGVLVGLTLPNDTPPEGVDLLELLMENCCDFAVQQDGSSKPDEVMITKPGKQPEGVKVDCSRHAQNPDQLAGGFNQPGLANPASGSAQGKNKYIISGPDSPSPSVPGNQQTGGPSSVPSYASTAPGSQQTEGNKYIISGVGKPVAPTGFGSASGAYIGGPSAYGGQVPVVHPDGTLTGAQAQRPKKVGERLAQIVGSGAVMLGQGIVKGGEWTAQKIQEHGAKQKAKMTPNERPSDIHPSIRTGARGANEASRTADATAKKVVGGVVYVITAVASSVGAAVKAVGGSQDPTKEPKIGARALAVASVDGIARVFDALEVSGKRVMASSREVGSDLMEYKYGAEAGQLTSDGMSTLGHMIHAGWTIRKLAFRTVARSAVTNSALHVIRNGNGNGNDPQAISGWNTAPSAEELDAARRTNQATVAMNTI